jgi:Spy/CpxP family protein refolding chaperone
MNGKVKGIIIVTIIGIFGFASLSFAGWRNGCGYGMGRDGRGMGWHHRDGNRYGMMKNYSSLSEEEIAKLDQQRSEFFKATEETRGQLYEKELALQSELAKENPDTNKASNLQQEISKLQGELDQERLKFEIQTRKASPNYNRTYIGHGRMMGHGYGQGGNCWR